ncbi:MAG: replicative DNA helicase [Candidatus Methylomirabilales bacterium]
MRVPSTVVEKIPPQAPEAEVAVLGAILLEHEALLKALELLRREYFYREAHRKIFAACQQLFERNEPVDLVTLGNELSRRHELEDVGGASYLASLVEAVPTAANVAYHARIVRDKALLRELIAAASEITHESFADREEVDETLDRAERRIFEISQDRVRRAFLPIRAVLKGTFEAIERLYDRKARVTGVPSGFAEFDALTSGFQSADLIIVAGRPSMGKTSFALNIAQHVAVEGRIPVAIFSLEMSKEQVVQRLLCAEARVDSHRLRTGYLRDSDWPRLTTAAGRLSEAPIFIDDTPGSSVLEMRAKARRLKAEQGSLGLVIADYLQLIRGRGQIENRVQEVSEITRSLKTMAKELETPVVALSQLSRAVERREERRPQLSDLRESGSIEQDADLVAFIYRPGVYKRGGEPVLGTGEEQEDVTAEVIIGKQRNGPTGVVRLAFLREYTRFEPLDPHREFA